MSNDSTITRHFSPSQKAFMRADEKQRVLMGGWRGGKTTAGINAGLLLSYYLPGNVGFIGRATGNDLVDTTIKTFEEFCPPSWILRPPKRTGPFSREYTIRSKDPLRPSTIIFKHIIDKQTGKSHIAGMNLGWFLVDQVEEIERADWIKLCGRLSLPGYKKHAMGVGNQNGHDWIFQDFFEGDPKTYTFDRANEPKMFYKETRKDGRLGIVVLPEENKRSNGGFVEDDFYDDQRRGKDPQFIARYLDSSFDDFNGKIYPSYNLTSVHNIEPWDIPAHYPTYGVIDPGGNVPWGVLKARVDENRNIIITDDAEELYQPDLNPNTAIRWIKQNFDVTRTRFTIDQAAKSVMIQFRDEGIVCEPALKDQMAGIIATRSQLYPVGERELPDWYLRTQPATRVQEFKGKGSPQIFVFNTCSNIRTEIDNYVWDLTKPNTPKRGQADHLADDLRYFVMSHYEAALPTIVDPYAAWRAGDPTSAYHVDHVSRELAKHRMNKSLTALRAEDPCDGGDGDGEPQFIESYGGF